MRVVRCGALWVVSVCAAACNERPPLCPEAHYDGEIPVAATSVALSAAQVPPVTAHTTSEEGGISVDIVDGVGTVSYEDRGPSPAFLFSEIPWDFINRTLYAGLGVADGVWYPFWLYCSNDGRLPDFPRHMTDRDVTVRRCRDRRARRRSPHDHRRVVHADRWSRDTAGDPGAQPARCRAHLWVHGDRAAGSAHDRPRTIAGRNGQLRDGNGTRAAVPRSRLSGELWQPPLV